MLKNAITLALKWVGAALVGFGVPALAAELVGPLTAVIVGCVLLVVYAALVKPWRFAPAQVVKPNDSTNGYLELRRVLLRCYEILRANGSILIDGAHGLSGFKDGEIAEGSPDEALDWLCLWFFGNEDFHVPLYGKHLPSDQIEKVPPEKVKRWVFSGGAKSIGPDKLNPKFFSLCVKAEDEKPMLDRARAS